MTRILTLAAILGLAACTPGQIQTAAGTPAGQLFCSIQLNGGGSMIATAVDAEASALAPSAAPVAIIATGMTKAYVDNACTQAAANANGVSGVPVSPPPAAMVVPAVAVVASKVAS